MFFSNYISKRVITTLLLYFLHLASLHIGVLFINISGQAEVRDLHLPSFSYKNISCCKVPVDELLDQHTHLNMFATHTHIHLFDFYSGTVFDLYLHFCQVLHASGDLPRKRDQVAHGESPVVWVLQVAGVSVGIPAHIARANFPTLTQEITEWPILGILNDEIQWTYSEKWSSETQCATHMLWHRMAGLRSYHPGCRLRTSLWRVGGWLASAEWILTAGRAARCVRRFLSRGKWGGS